MCFNLNSLPSTPEVFDVYAHSLPTHHQSLGSAGLCLVLSCRPQCVVPVCFGSSNHFYFKSRTALAQWSESGFEFQDFPWFQLTQFQVVWCSGFALRCPPWVRLDRSLQTWEVGTDRFSVREAAFCQVVFGFCFNVPGITELTFCSVLSVPASVVGAGSINTCCFLWQVWL